MKKRKNQNPKNENERITRLKYLCSEHAYYSKVAKKLTETEFDIMVDFIDDYADKTSSEFKSLILRRFVDCDKPKNWNIIEDLLIASA